jgi:hypothetical protein
MMGKAIMAEDWKAAADQAARKRKGAWIGTAVTAGIAGLLWSFALNTDGGVRLALLAAGALMVAIAFAYGTAIYMRRVDEQERTANLWASYASLCIYVLLYCVKIVVAQFGVVVPHSEALIFLAVLASFLAVFLWQRFR